MKAVSFTWFCSAQGTKESTATKLDTFAVAGSDAEENMPFHPALPGILHCYNFFWRYQAFPKSEPVRNEGLKAEDGLLIGKAVRSVKNLHGFN